MKMAKASEADLRMALDLCQMLEGFERGHFPADEDAEDYEPFGAENAWQCLRAMELILDKLQEGSLSRVVFGMVVLLNPKNEAIDHSLDYLEHHPKVRMHDELVAALRYSVKQVPELATVPGIAAVLAKLDDHENVAARLAAAQAFMKGC